MMDWEECLNLSKDLRRKMYIPEMTARQLCPQAKFTNIEFPDMGSFEIKYDSLDKFFKENNVTVIYIDADINKRRGPLGIISATTVIVKCRIENDRKTHDV